MGPPKKQEERKCPTKPSASDQAGSYFLCSDSSIRHPSAWEPLPWALSNLTQEQVPEDGERVSRKCYWKEKWRHTGQFHQNKLPHSFYSTVVDGSPILQHGPAQKKTQGLAEKQKSVGLTSGLAPFLTSLQELAKLSRCPQSPYQAICTTQTFKYKSLLRGDQKTHRQHRKLGCC